MHPAIFMNYNFLVFFANICYFRQHNEALDHSDNTESNHMCSTSAVAIRNKLSDMCLQHFLALYTILSLESTALQGNDKTLV